MDLRLLEHGLQTSIRNNAAAYAYSVAVTGSLAIVQTVEGAPVAGEIGAFVISAGLAFTGVEALASRGFRNRVRPERSDVVMLGSAISPLSIGASVAAAFLVARLLGGWPAWALGGFAATFVYLLVSGLEMAFARKAAQSRDGDDEAEEEPEAD